MHRALTWLLSLLILASFACGQGDGGATADSETVASEGGAEPQDPGPMENPREPKEVWPEVLAQRDRVRSLMAKSDIWYDDLEQLEGEILTLLRLVGEVVDWVQLNPESGIDYSAVARTRVDVRVAVFPIRSAARAKAPGMWRHLAPPVDQALRLMEMRFPDGLGSSILDRPDYAKPLYETAEAP